MTGFSTTTARVRERVQGRPALADRVFYGWIMLPVAMAAMFCTAPAQTFGVSVFKPAMLEGLGLSPAQFAGAYTLGTLLGCMPLTFVGRMMDHHGIRRTMTAVVLLAGTACLFMSQVRGLVTMGVGFLLLRMFGQGSLMLLSKNTLPQWFDRRLGLVSGIYSLAPAGAIALAPMLHLWLMEQVGWRGAYVLLGGMIVAVMLPLLLLFFRNRPEDIGQSVDGVNTALDLGADGVLDAGVERSGDDRAGPAEAGRSEPAFTLAQARRTRAYWIMAAETCCAALTKTAVTFSALSIFLSRGMEAEVVALMFVAFGGTMAVVRLGMGWLADRAPLNMMISLATTFLALSMGMIWLARTPAMVVGVGVLLGMQQGTKGAVMDTLWRRYYGRAHLGRIRGSFSTLVISASAVGPLLVDGVYDLMGSYDSILAAFALVPLPLIVAGLFATQPQRG